MLSRLTQLLAIVALCASCDARKPNDRAAQTRTPEHKTATSADCAERLVFGDNVGPIHLGMAVDALRRACPIVPDTTVRPLPGSAERHLSVLLGADTAVVSVGIGRVHEILLASGTFHTADSIGIGTPLRVLLARDHIEGFGVAGHLLVQTPSECGLTFGIAGHYPDLPDGAKDSATLARVPLTAVVDRIRIDGCERDEDKQFATGDDSTYDVQTDTVMLARDLDGNGVTDYVVRESRPYHARRTYTFRLVVYLDSIPASRRPRWSSGWNMEGEATLGDVASLGSRGSLLEVYGNEADYTSETLLAIRDGSITEELTHGEDYGEGFLELKREGAALVVDASQMHLELRGAPVGPELECKDGDWPAVRLQWNEASRRFVPDKPRCIKARRGDDAKPSAP